MIIVGAATWGILSLLHVGYPILLAVMTGVLSGVPGFGMTVSTIITALVAILDNSHMWTNSPTWLEALIILVLFFVFNKFIDLIIAPIFLGKTNKVNPFIVVVLVILGTVLMGVPGAILAVPVYLVVRTIIDHFEGK
jgi:predicted PurR-regulated permease PerM